mmetsp:Transcript_67074/g.199468  ORF Transcript_67074/g.199468 Transcript_67074/m.199468 type:complete len:203 (-) Transcript_67074:323-931(-)
MLAVPPLHAEGIWHASCRRLSWSASPSASLVMCRRAQDVAFRTALWRFSGSMPTARRRQRNSHRTTFLELRNNAFLTSTRQMPPVLHGPRKSNNSSLSGPLTPAKPNTKRNSWRPRGRSPGTDAMRREKASCSERCRSSTARRTLFRIRPRLKAACSSLARKASASDATPCDPGLLLRRRSRRAALLLLLPPLLHQLVAAEL